MDLRLKKLRKCLNNFIKFFWGGDELQLPNAGDGANDGFKISDSGFY